MSNEPQTLKDFRLRADVKAKLKAKESGLFDRYVDEYRANELREILRAEQGSICCYCMSSIATGKTKIEHYESRDENHELEVDYKNLYLACDGEKINCHENQDKDSDIHEDCRCKHDDNVYGEKDSRKLKESFKKIVKHCDTCKGARALEHINLLTIERDVKYKSDGTIYSDNADIDRELNYVLNLNIEILKRNRRNAKIDLWSKLPKDKSWNSESINRIIEKYKNSSQKAPYLGVILYFLGRKLQRG